MQTYLLTIHVTVEQEEAIQQLYVERGWLFEKTSVTQPEKSRYLNYQNYKEASSLSVNSENGKHNGSWDFKPSWHKNVIEQNDELQKQQLFCETTNCQKDGSGNNLSTEQTYADSEAASGESKELCTADTHAQKSKAGIDTTWENYTGDNEILKTNVDTSSVLTKKVSSAISNTNVTEESGVYSDINAAEKYDVTNIDERKQSVNTKTHEVKINCGTRDSDDLQGFNHDQETEVGNKIELKTVHGAKEDQANDVDVKNIDKNSLATMKITGQKTSSELGSRSEVEKVSGKEPGHQDKESLERKAKSKQKKTESKPQRKEKREKCKSKTITARYTNDLDVTEKNNGALKGKVRNEVPAKFKQFFARDKHRNNNKRVLKETDGVTFNVNSDKNSLKLKEDNKKFRGSRIPQKQRKLDQGNTNNIVGSSSQNDDSNGSKQDLTDSDSTLVDELDTETADSKPALGSGTSCEKNDQYLCQYCQQVFLTELPYRKHIKNHEKQAFDCPECGKKFTNRRNLNSHMFKRTKQRTFNCDNCNFVTTTACLLRIHKKKTHQQKINYQCHLCAKIVKTKSYLNVHLKFSHNIDEGKYLCPFCGQKSKRPKLFAKHLKDHMNDGDYSDRQCSVCRKIFKTKRHLRSHRRVHQERTHLCDFCGKGFTTRTKLEAHNRTHTGLKPYKCKICDYKSTQSGNLRLHMKVHEKEESKKQQLEETANISAQVVPNVSKNKNENITETNYSTKACTSNIQSMPGEKLPTVSETFSRNTLPSYMEYLQSSGNMSSLTTTANTLTSTGLDKETNIQTDSMAQTYTDMTYNIGKDYNSVYQAEQMADGEDIEKARYPTDRLHSSQLGFDSSDLFNSAPTHNASGIGEYSHYPRSYTSNHTMYAAEHAEVIPDHTLSDAANLNRQSNTSSQLCSQFSNLPEALYPSTQADEYSGTAPLPSSDSQPGMFGISRTDLETATQAYSDNFDIDYNATVQSIYDSNQSFDEDRSTDNIETTSSSSRNPLVWVYTVCNF